MKIEIGNEYKVCKVNASIGGPAFYEWYKIIIADITGTDNDTLSLEEFKLYITNDTNDE